MENDSFFSAFFMMFPLRFYWKQNPHSARFSFGKFFFQLTEFRTLHLFEERK